MLQIRWNSQNCEGITNHYVQRINLKRDKLGELGGKGLKLNNDVITTDLKQIIALNQEWINEFI